LCIEAHGDGSNNKKDVITYGEVLVRGLGSGNGMSLWSTYSFD